MNKVLYIILISLFSLTIISCAKKSSDDSSSSSGSSDSDMKLSDIQANFNNKTDFIVGEKQSTNSGRNIRSPLRTSTSSENLIVKDNDSDLDYGLISDYSIQVSDVIISRSNEYAFILLDYYKDWRNKDAPDENLKSINCTILKVTIATNDIQCLEDLNVNILFLPSTNEMYKNVAPVHIPVSKLFNKLSVRVYRWG